MGRKFHSFFKHWINSILRYGCPFLYSGEANEEFHKVACKVTSGPPPTTFNFDFACCILSRAAIFPRYVTDIIWQWAYNRTNKREHEGQMVTRLTQFDAMAYATRNIQDLGALSSKFGPPKEVKAHLEFAGIIQFVP